MVLKEKLKINKGEDPPFVSGRYFLGENGKGRSIDGGTTQPLGGSTIRWLLSSFVRSCVL